MLFTDLITPGLRIPLKIDSTGIKGFSDNLVHWIKERFWQVEKQLYSILVCADKYNSLNSVSPNALLLINEFSLDEKSSFS